MMRCIEESDAFNRILYSYHSSSASASDTTSTVRGDLFFFEENGENMVFASSVFSCGKTETPPVLPYVFVRGLLKFEVVV